MSEAEELYAEYRARRARLDVLRAYAKQVVAATGGRSSEEMTPVQPLATMGHAGGALVCDVCGEPMVLEGGRDHRRPVDAAWRRDPTPRSSWILGGMVLLIEMNGTLRVYHGYPGRSGCVLEADRADREARLAFRRDDREVTRKLDLLGTELKLSDGVLSDVFAVLFMYDPGLGVNQP